MKKSEASAREVKIAKRRSEIPRAYRAVYDRAVASNSLRAAINAHCLECIGYRTAEVRACTALACPLYAVRPYQESSQSGRDGRVTGAESANGGQTATKVGPKRKTHKKAGKPPVAKQLGFWEESA